MKKFLIFITMLSISLSSFAWNWNTKHRYEHYGFDVNVGLTYPVNGPKISPTENIKDFGRYGMTGIVSIGAIIHNVYGDVQFSFTGHGNDYRINIWEDSKTIGGHIGYTLPINDNWYITPMFGVIRYSVGVTDGADWYVGYNGVHNRFHELYNQTKFDIGVKCDWMFSKHIGINAKVTYYSASVGFTFFVK